MTANPKSALSIFILLLVFYALCRPALSEDTISSIQGKHPKKPAHVARQTHPALHLLVQHKRVAVRRVSRSVKVYRVAAYRTPKAAHRTTPSSTVAQASTPEQPVQDINPIAANSDALNLLKSGRWRDGMSVFSAQQALFRDDFNHPESNSDRWTWSENGGKINSRNDSLELSAKGHAFPVIQTLNDPFPIRGDWAVSVGYRFTASTVCGTSLKVVRLDGSGRPDLAVLHEDNNGQFLSIDGIGEVWHLPANTDWHVLTLLKQSGYLRAIMDGHLVATTGAGIAPVGFRFGNTGTVSWDADWTSQQIRFVEVTAPRIAAADELDTKLPMPVGWWEAADNSVKSINSSGVTHGKVAFVPGLFSQAFSFDGASGINIPDMDSLKFTKSFSISAWVKVMGLPELSHYWGQILFRGDNRIGLDPYFLAVGPFGTYTFQIDSADGNFASVQAPVHMNQWVLLTATLDDRSGLMTLYINGKSAANVGTTVRPLRNLDSNANPGIAIGDEGNYANMPSHEHFQGDIEEVELFDVALTQSQISGYYSRKISQADRVRNNMLNPASLR